jgi:hypothetical protein
MRVTDGITMKAFRIRTDRTQGPPEDTRDGLAAQANSRLRCGRHPARAYSP